MICAHSLIVSTFLRVKWRGALDGDSRCQTYAAQDAAARRRVARKAEAAARERRALPAAATGTHGLDPELVKRDQRSRLQKAMVELIAAKGYPGVRIVDLAKLAHVSQPTFYSLYADKEDLFLSAYDEVAQRTASTVIDAYEADGPPTSAWSWRCARSRAGG